MFDFFKKKQYCFQCPMCGRGYDIRFDPGTVTNFDYKYAEGGALIGREKCGFCKIEMTFVLSKNGYTKAVDEEWAKIEYEYYQQQGLIDDEIFEIEDKLELDNQNGLLTKKHDELSTKKDKLELNFLKKEEKYCNRQENWKDKWRQKSERS